MRHPLGPTLVFVALLLVYSVAGVAVADADTPDAVTVDGTVTAPDGSPAGDAVVLIGEYSMLRKLSPAELREIAADDPQDLAVVEVDSDGSFAAEVPWKRADAAVALSDAGISEIARLGNEGATVDFQLDERRAQHVYVNGGAAEFESTRTFVLVNMMNNADGPVENLTVSFDTLPEGWTVVGVESDGTFDADNRTITWSSIAPGDGIDVRVDLAIPENATPGEYPLAVSATSTSHPLVVETEPLSVQPEQTPGPTKTSVGGDLGTTTPRESRTTTTTPSPTGVTSPTPSPHADGGVKVPGFGAGVALAALVAALLAVARTDRR